MKLIGLVFLFTLTHGIPLEKIDIEDKNYWRSIGSATLDHILKKKINNGVAKNVIIFVGDGMGIPTVTMARVYQGQLKNVSGETNTLSFEKFPTVGLSKTYDVSHQVADSASTATAIFSGSKTNQAVIGLDAIASYGSCDAESNNRAKVKGFMTWGQEKGKDTGIITTARVTHATPAGTYAHINSRDWECDGEIPNADRGCVKDIARQLIEDEPGKKFKVILGGGRQQLGIDTLKDTSSCSRTDQKNLLNDWQANKTNAKYVSTAAELLAVDVSRTDYLLGLFAPGHMKYVGEKEPTRPSLKLMTETAINMLKKNQAGFFLMVEAARIDIAHHGNYAKLALMETVEFDEAIEAAVKMTDEEDTLIIVTADHSHSAIMNGYPKRGNNVLDFAENTNKTFYETITYANGPGFAYHHPQNSTELGQCYGQCSDEEKLSMSLRRDIRKIPDRESNVFYQHFSPVHKRQSSHGGEDVGVFALGPKSHLLDGVYEQNYIATVVSYASCVGPEAHRCENEASSSTSLHYYLSLSLLLFGFLWVLE